MHHTLKVEKTWERSVTACAGDQEPVPVSAGRSADTPGSLSSCEIPAPPPWLCSLPYHSFLRTPWHYPTRAERACVRTGSSHVFQQRVGERARLKGSQYLVTCIPWKTMC